MTWLEEFVEKTTSQVDDRIVESLNLRGVSDDQIRLFSIGHVDQKLPSLSSSYPEEFLRWSFQGTKLEDCYCFPLTSPLGEVLGFQFRPVLRERKGYMDYFVETGEPILFGLREAMPEIWKTESVTLVEGPFDLFPIQRHDRTALATLSAYIQENLIRNLKRVCRRLIVGYDNDATGVKATKRIQKDHAEDFQIQELPYPKIPMPGGKVTKDPADLWEIWGDQHLGEYVRKKTTRGVLSYV